MQIGLDLLAFNLRGEHGAYSLWVLAFGALPLVPVLVWRKLPSLVKAFALLSVPYVALMLWFGVLAETRLFLVPFALVVIPAVVIGLRGD